MPRVAKASFQARLWASATPVFPPHPPVGGITWAASPARKTRPRWKDPAVAAIRLQGREDGQETGVAREGEPEEPRQLRMVDVHHAEVPVPHEVVHIGLEVDRDAVGEAAMAGHGYAQLLTDGAVRTVGRDEIVGDD